MPSEGRQQLEYGQLMEKMLLIGALPGLPAGPLLAASLAQQLLGIVAEAGVSRAWLALGRRWAT